MSRSVWKNKHANLTLVRKFDEVRVDVFDQLPKYLLNRTKSFKTIFEIRDFIHFCFSIHTSNDPIVVWSRDSTILPSFVGFNVNVYTGHHFVRILLSPSMVNMKFGELVYTKRMAKQIHNSAVKAKKSKTSPVEKLKKK